MAKKADIEELERGQSDVMSSQDGKPCIATGSDYADARVSVIT